MTRRWLVTVLLAAAMATPLRAELKYTMRMEAHKSTAPAAADQDPIMSMLASMIASSVLPASPVELVVIVGPKGARTEYPQAFTVLPAGSVSLVRPDGSMIVMNPADKTYWKIAKPDLSALMPGITPIVTTRRTGATAAVAGVPAAQIAIEVKIPLPVPSGAQMPPGFPTELSMQGEMWVTDRYKDYAKLAAASVTGFAGIGMDKVVTEGLALRSVMRSALFGDQELESVVTKIGEEPAAASLFEIPDGYKEYRRRAGWVGLAASGADVSELITRERAWALVTEHVQSESLRKHLLAVEAAVRGYARMWSEDEEGWGFVALVHDFDYEQYPDRENHPFRGVDILRGLGYPDWITRAILSHADYSGVPRESRLEHTLYACDEMSGFVTAAALVRPSKSVMDLEASSVLKRMKDKAFARAVPRDDLTRGADELGLPIAEHITNVIAFLRVRAGELGLIGSAG